MDETKTKTNHEYPTALTDIITRLTRAQEMSGLADTGFAKRYLTYDVSVWYRLKNAEYPPGKKPERLAQILTRDLRRWNQERANHAKIKIDGRRTYEFAHVRAVRNAIELAREANNENRGILFLAPPGGGKSTLLRLLREENEAVLVEGRESWRESNFAALQDICAAIEADGADNLGGEHAAEVAMLAKLNQKQIILGIDEAEYFGPRSINILKLILNKTPSVLVVAAIPELWGRITKTSWVESKQFIRRLQAVVRTEIVAPAEVEMFIEAPFRGDKGQVLSAIAQEANRFGHFDFVRRVADRINEECSEGVGLTEAETSIRELKALLRAA